MPSILQDFRYALHMLRKSAGFTATATAILALVIGSTTTIFMQAIFPPGTRRAWILWSPCVVNETIEVAQSSDHR